MLVLSRNSGQKTIITTKSGEEIVVTILLANRGRARIGIDAPLSTTVVREEVALRRKQKQIGVGVSGVGSSEPTRTEQDKLN